MSDPTIVSDTFSYINIYMRVSTMAQYNDDRYGIEKQLEVCSKYIDDIYGQEPSNVYEDIGSTYQFKNTLPSLNRLVKNIPYRSLIVIHAVSRLGRNVEQVMNVLSKLRKKKCKIYAITDNVCYGKTRLLDKRFYYHVVKSEESSDLKSQRTITKIKLIKRLGGHIGAVPYGYKTAKVNGLRILTKDPKEQKIMKEIKSFLVKKRTMEYIVNYLKKKYKTKRGFEWSARTVKSINFRTHYKTYKTNDVIDDLDNLKL